MALLRENQQTPTIEQIAAAADVARRTIYLHFPTLDHLLLDATSGLLSEAGVDAQLDLNAPGDDPAARVATLARALCDRTTLPLGRQIIALTVTAAPTDGPVKRGSRRLDWIERTVQPLRPRLSDEQHQRLVSALAVALGWEAMVVLQDICGLDADRERTVMTWLAAAIINAMINEVGPDPT
jgi:AcrR family transcriptional regulator